MESPQNASASRNVFAEKAGRLVLEVADALQVPEARRDAEMLGRIGSALHQLRASIALAGRPLALPGRANDNSETVWDEVAGLLTRIKALAEVAGDDPLSMKRALDEIYDEVTIALDRAADDLDGED